MVSALAKLAMSWQRAGGGGWGEPAVFQDLHYVSHRSNSPTGAPLSCIDSTDLLYSNSASWFYLNVSKLRADLFKTSAVC